MIFLVDYYSAPEGEILYADDSAEELERIYKMRVAETNGKCEIMTYDDEIEPEICSELKDRLFL